MTCSINGCLRLPYARGWCKVHYHVWYRRGDPTAKTVHKGALVRWLNEHAKFRGEDCLIWPFYRSKSGYAGHVCLPGTSGKKTTLAHRYMCAIAHGEPLDPSHEVAHRCGNGALGCVNPLHLRWATPRENAQDKRRHGTDPSGTRNPRAKLSEMDVRSIRMSKRSGQELADKFEVTRTTISFIRLGRTWSDM